MLTYRGRIGTGAIRVQPSQADLLRDQVQAGLAEAAHLLTNDTEVELVVYKTTKARGTERDRTFTVSRDRQGRIVAQ